MKTETMTKVLIVMTTKQHEALRRESFRLAMKDGSRPSASAIVRDLISKWMAGLTLAVALLTGCGSPLEVVRDFDPGTPYVPSWATGDMEALKARTIAAADAAARVWGKSTSDLDGWTIIFTATDLPNSAAGLAESRPYGGIIWIDVRHDGEGGCVEISDLAHEIGHAVGNHGHSDPRWHSVDFGKQMGTALRESVPESESYCRQILEWGQQQGLPMGY